MITVESCAGNNQYEEDSDPFHVLLFVVGAGRFELPTSWSQTMRAKPAAPRPDIFPIITKSWTHCEKSFPFS
jgi:hypothetical protein